MKVMHITVSDDFEQWVRENAGTQGDGPFIEELISESQTHMNAVLAQIRTLDATVKAQSEAIKALRMTIANTNNQVVSISNEYREGE